MGNQTNSLIHFLSKIKPRRAVITALAVILTFLLVILLNLSWRPDVKPLPPDSGFYAYFGEAILQGQLPYRDVWDDKPPFGYYLNALGLAVFGQTPWGVWWSSVFWITGCTVLFFLLLRKLFGKATALAACAIFLAALMNPQIFQGGNMMEVYSLAPQIGILGATGWFFTSRKPWAAVLVGVLTACAFLIKQPTIILGCSSLLVMLVSSLSGWKIREAIRTGLGFLAGVAGLFALVSAPWLLAGAFNQLLDGAFLQGVSFVGGFQGFGWNFTNMIANVLPKMDIGILLLIAILVCGWFILEKLYPFWLKPVWKTRLSWVDWACMAAIVAFPLVANRLWPRQNRSVFWIASIFLIVLFILVKVFLIRRGPPPRQGISLLEWTWLIGAVALPFETLMASAGGKYYGHYFITLLPATTIIIAYPFWKVITGSKVLSELKPALLHNAVYVALAVSALVWGAGAFLRDIPSTAALNNFTGIFSGKVPLNQVEQYILQTTAPDDGVLVWHIHVGINFTTQRRAPSRFLYPFNLIIPPNAQNTKLEEFVNDLENHPPELILYQRANSMAIPFVDTPLEKIDPNLYKAEFIQALAVPQIRQQWLRFQQFFATHYAPDRDIYDWIIFRRLR